MKFLIFSLCLSVTTADNLGHYYSGSLAGVIPLVPAAASGGLVPADTPAVIAARAEHFSLGGGGGYAAGYGYGLYGLVPGAASGGLVPVDTPAVAAARAEHLAAHGAAYTAAAPIISHASAAPIISYASAPAAYAYSGPLAGVPALVPAAASGGLVPADEPAVAVARAHHLSLLGSTYASGYGYSGPLAGALPLVPGAASGGLVPVNTPDVVAARADFAARGGAIIPAPAAPAISYASAPAAISYGSGYGYAGPLAGVRPLVPGAASGGLVPADTPDVVAARAAFAAKGGATIPASDSVAYAAPIISYASAPAAIAYGSGYGYAGPLAGVPALVPAAASGGLVPANEPAVAAARADHLALLGSSYSAGPLVISSPISYTSAPAIEYGYTGPLAGVPALVPAAASGGLVPADEPAVVAARAEHFALGGGIIGGVYAGGAIGGVYGTGYTPYGGLISYPNGALVPADEPAVVAARAEHFAAKEASGW